MVSVKTAMLKNETKQNKTPKLIGHGGACL